jgi:hypothetical protein
MLKLIAPHRAERIHTAQDLLNVLTTLKAYRQLPAIEQKTIIPSLNWEDLAGQIPKRPNFNPFVSYLKTIYSQNTTSNRGTRGIDALA